MSARVLVVGAGALGGVMAAKLTRAGRDVSVIDANVAHVAQMNSPGLRVNVIDEEWLVPINAVSDVSELAGPFDFALLTIKSPFIKAAIQPLLDRELVGTYVSLGNGLIQDRIQELTGQERLVIGTVSWGATNFGPGHVAQTTIAPISIGEIHGGMTDRLRNLADVLEVIAEVHYSDGIYGQVWAKLLLNSTFSGLSAVTGLVYGDVCALPQGRELAFKLWTEGYDVACALGIDLDEVAGVDPLDLVVRGSAELPHANRTLDELMARIWQTKASMLQDLEKGALTEVDVINGGVVENARRMNLPSPYNSSVVEILHSCENDKLMPGVSNLALMGGLTGGL